MNTFPSTSTYQYFESGTINTGATITLFAVPKAFDGFAETIQRNAVESWKCLAPEVDVLLLGDEPGIRESAAEIGVRHVGELQRNEHGTPLLSSAFRLAHEHSDSPVLMYCNSDVILDRAIVEAIHCLLESDLAEQFVAFGRRLDVPIDWEIQFDRLRDQARLAETVVARGRRAPVVCKEYFAFPRTVYNSIPDFAVGRGNWDNWMIHHARANAVPAVDLSDRIQVLHQTHGYQLSQGKRRECYVTGSEARENERLAGGKHIVSGSSGTWRLTEHGLEKTPLPALNMNFWCDLPRFLQLIAQLSLNLR